MWRALPAGRLGLIGCSLACGETSQDSLVTEPLPLTACGEALENLHDWSGRAAFSSQITAGLVVACEDGRSMATSDRLECLLQQDPESAARCVIRLERKAMIDACVSDAGEDFHSECEESLAEPSPVLLAQRMRPLEDGSWLDLWRCHTPSESELAPEHAQLLECGLAVLEKVAVADCRASLFSAADCASRWQIQSPRAREFLLEQVVPPG